MKSLIEQGKLLSLSAGEQASNATPISALAPTIQNLDKELDAHRSIPPCWRVVLVKSGTLNHQKHIQQNWSAPMTATLLYRIAAFVLVLFAAGHTLGFLKFKAPTPEGVAVQQAMDNVRFNLEAKSYSYGDFYRGFGLFCTAYLLFTAFLAWQLGAMARNTPQAIGALGWVFCGLQVLGIVLSWRYFVLPPTIFSAVLAILTGWAAWLVNAAKP